MRRLSLVLLLAGAVWAPAASGQDLSIAQYVQLTLDLLQQGIDGWEEMVETLADEEHEDPEARVAEIKADLLEQEEATLRRHGVTKEELQRFGAEQRQQAEEFLRDSPEEQKALIEGALRFRELMIEYATLTGSLEASEDDG